MALNRQRDRVIGDYRIINTRTVHRLKRWRLIQVREGVPPVAASNADTGPRAAWDKEPGLDGRTS